MEAGKSGKLSHYLYNQRVKAILPFINKGNILEVGCGGWPLLSIWKNRKHYYGIDIEQETIAKVSQQYPESNLIVADISKTNDFFGQVKFHNIVMLAVIEHLSSPKKVVTMLSTRLKKDGKIIITTPRPIGNVVLKIGALLGLFDVSAEEEHKSLFNKKELMDFIAGTNLTVFKYKRFCLGLNQIIVLGLD